MDFGDSRSISHEPSAIVCGGEKWARQRLEHARLTPDTRTLREMHILKPPPGHYLTILWLLFSRTITLKESSSKT